MPFADPTQRGPGDVRTRAFEMKPQRAGSPVVIVTLVRGRSDESGGDGRVVLGCPPLRSPTRPTGPSWARARVKPQTGPVVELLDDAPLGT